MHIILPKQIDRSTWLRYLGVTGSPDVQLQGRLALAEAQLLQAALPRGIYRVLPRQEVACEGMSIEKHLEGCEKVAILSVTLGSGVDALIKQQEIRNMAAAVILDAGASVLIEHAADDAEQQMKEELRGKVPGLYTTSRFSPGYGDYPIRHQREILRLVDAPRKIGVTLTAGDMMTPSKSITALVGLADHPVTGRLATCGECLLRDKCQLWRNGTHC